MVWALVDSSLQLATHVFNLGADCPRGVVTYPGKHPETPNASKRSRASAIRAGPGSTVGPVALLV